MSTLKVHDARGGEVGEFDVPDALLVLDRGDQAVHDAVIAHLAECRAGTASTLSKGEVRGSGRKPWRQKGTGRARAGYRQSPVWRGGGVAFGPHPRDFGVKVNRKVARLAFRRALSAKIQAGDVRVVDALQVSEARTRELAGMLKALGVGDKALIVVDRVDEKLLRAGRNLPGVEIVRAADADVYRLLRYPAIVASREGMETLCSRLGANNQGASR